MTFSNFLKTTLFVLLSFGLSNAQNTGLISGALTNADGKTLGGELVSLLRSDKTTLVKTSLTDPDGSFVFDNLQPATYFVSVSGMEYEAYLSNPIAVDGQNPVF